MGLTPQKETRYVQLDEMRNEADCEGRGRMEGVWLLILSIFRFRWRRALRRLSLDWSYRFHETDVCRLRGAGSRKDPRVVSFTALPRVGLHSSTKM